MDATRFERIDRAASLPAEWDQLASCSFQQQEFLHHTDVYNPCKQRYYLLWNNHQLLAGACVYTLSLHLFTFSRIPSKINMQVIGLPASVSAPGIMGTSNNAIEQLLQYLFRNEKGLLLCLNLAPGITATPGIAMTMMPTVVLKQNFSSWEQYVSALRSPYRRRALQLQEAFREVRSIRTGCDAFTEQHYALYRQIMQHTKDKLETLSAAFFKHLPPAFQLTSYYREQQLLCWHITCSDADVLFFFFGGHDYGLLDQYHSYFNNLFGIIKEAIEGHYQHIDFGQTAETAKMKTGGQMVHKQLVFYHHHFLLRLLLRLFRPLITYHPPKAIVHPLREHTTFIHSKNKHHEDLIREAETIA